MKIAILFVLSVVLLTGCAGSPLGSLINKHPSEADVDAMTVDKTTRKEVDEKFSGSQNSIVNGLKCELFFKPSLIGEGTKTTYLCFDDKGILKQKYFQ